MGKKVLPPPSRRQPMGRSKEQFPAVGRAWRQSRPCVGAAWLTPRSGPHPLRAAALPCTGCRRSSACGGGVWSPSKPRPLPWACPTWPHPLSSASMPCSGYKAGGTPPAAAGAWPAPSHTPTGQPHSNPTLWAWPHLSHTPSPHQLSPAVNAEPKGGWG